MKNRVYNFAAGPSMLADEVLNKLHEEFYNYEGSGMAVMAALVGNSPALRSIRKGYRFFYRKSIHIRPESDGG